MKVYICEDSIDGIFTGIYDAFCYVCNGQGDVKLQTKSNKDDFFEQELFCEYEEMAIDSMKAGKVAKAIKKKISERAYNTVIRAALSQYSNKAEMIFEFLRIGFKTGASIMDNLSNKYVMALFEMNRNVEYEEHHYLGFLRFTEIVEAGKETEINSSDGKKKRRVLLAKYEPKNNITSLIAPHFVSRLHEENFIIFDVKRGIAALYEVGHQWLLAELGEDIINKYTELSESEDEYQKLWLIFFKSIGIEARNNEPLQKNLLRLRYRKYMTEFA